MKKILLVGNPNVGKSVLFNRLTGIDVISSNYPGTTVGFTKGYTRIKEEQVEIIDVPGTYTLEPTCKAEEVALKMLEEGDVIVNVVDAANLERNLNLTLQLLKCGKPLVIVLNLWDETKHLGIEIDVNKLEQILGFPVIPTIAVTGKGIKELTDRLSEAKQSSYTYEKQERWHEVGKIVDKVQKITHKHHTFWENLSDISISPLTGIPIAVIVLFLAFLITRFIGENLISYVLNPLYNKFYAPFIIKFIGLFKLKFLQEILLGQNTQAMEGFGILTTGIYIPFVVVLPYIFSFYLVLSLLEDIGYLPRLAILLDTTLHKVGLHGYGTVPIILGLGCKVPAMLATRILETRREKMISTILVILIAPCIPQSAMIISLLAKYGIKYLVLTFGVIFLVGISSGYFLNKILKGEVPELFIEIPPVRSVKINLLLKKLWIRVKGFIKEAIPLIIFGVLIVNIFESLGIVRIISNSFGLLITRILGVPNELISVIILGFLRKDISIALLSPYNLAPMQIVISSIFLTLYLPCISTFFIMCKEVGIRNALKIIFFTSLIALSICGILSLGI